jgi:hypothetical protein
MKARARVLVCAVSRTLPDRRRRRRRRFNSRDSGTYISLHPSQFQSSISQTIIMPVPSLLRAPARGGVASVSGRGVAMVGGATAAVRRPSVLARAHAHPDRALLPDVSIAAVWTHACTGSIGAGGAEREREQGISRAFPLRGVRKDFARARLSRPLSAPPPMRDGLAFRRGDSSTWSWAQQRLSIPPARAHEEEEESSPLLPPVPPPPSSSPTTQNFGARDPTAGELASNFSDKVLGNWDTEHIIK